MKKMEVEALLALNKFNVDEKSPHIKIDDTACSLCESRPCLYICPAKCYVLDEGSEAVRFDYAGCLECGTCRLACRQLGNGGVVQWEYPRGTFGVSFRNA